jgi:hypothetical protein
MLRTIAVLLLLLGLATATPVVCLCLPTEAAGLTAGARQTAPDSAGYAERVAVDLGQTALVADRAGLAEGSRPTGSSVADAPSLIATSAAAAVAMLVATAAAGLPLLTPWHLPPLSPMQQVASPMADPGGPIWSPAPRPPRSA